MKRRQRLMVREATRKLAGSVGYDATISYDVGEDTFNPNGKVDEKSITCHTCGRTSYHGEDIHKRYCGYCNFYHQHIQWKPVEL